MFLDVILWPMIAAGVGMILGAAALVAVAAVFIVKYIKKKKAQDK